MPCMYLRTNQAATNIGTPIMVTGLILSQSWGRISTDPMRGWDVGLIIEDRLSSSPPFISGLNSFASAPREKKPTIKRRLWVSTQSIKAANVSHQSKIWLVPRFLLVVDPTKAKSTVYSAWPDWPNTECRRQSCRPIDYSERYTTVQICIDHDYLIENLHVHWGSTL